MPADGLIVFGSFFLLIYHDLEKNFKSGFCSERREFVALFRKYCLTHGMREVLCFLCPRPQLSNQTPVDRYSAESFLFPGLAGLRLWVFASPRVASAG